MVIYTSEERLHPTDKCYTDGKGYSGISGFVHSLHGPEQTVSWSIFSDLAPLTLYVFQVCHSSNTIRLYLCTHCSDHIHC